MSDGHYFDKTPDVASDRREVRLSLPDMTIDLETDRGVFSHGSIDAGTKLLLRDAGTPPPGHVLDLGCGAGPIALTMASRNPDAIVWAVDVNDRAVDLCRHNAERNGLRNVHAVSPDDVPADVAFAAIWSNPPIRIGKPALHDLLVRWLDRLAGDGEALLVVQRHLGADSLAKWLSEQTWHVERVTSAQGYRLLRLHRPHPLT